MSNLNYVKADNNTLISRLYALRAGLSVATTEAENAKKLEREELNLMEQRDHEINNYSSQISELEKKVEQIERRSQLSIESPLNKKSDCFSKILKSVFFPHLLLCMLYISVALVFLLFHEKFDMLVFEQTDALFYGLHFICPPILLVFLIVRIVKMRRDYHLKNCIHDYKNACQNLNNSIKERNDNRKKLPAEKKKLKELKDHQQSKVDSIKKNYNPQIKEKGDKKNTHIRSGVIFCSCLDRQFCDLIDRRDWKYVDYIIFCLETGRADTLKESLKFADEENRTQRLENAIEQAKNSIENTINSRFDSLQNVMVAEFANLNSSINSAMASMSSQINSKMSSLQSSVNSRLSEISSAQYANNALIKNMTYNTYIMAKSCDYLNAQNPRFI